MATEKQRTVQGLRDSVYHKAEAHRQIQDEWRKFRRNAIAETTDKIDLYCKTVFEARRQEAGEALAQAESELHAEQERIALQGEGAPYPLGTRMVGQRQKSRFDPATTVYGVVEAITRDSVHDEKRRQYRKAPIGDFVVRHLLATGIHDTTCSTGSPSQVTRFEAVTWKPAKTYDTSFHGWKPVDSTIQRNEAFFAPKKILI